MDLEASSTSSDEELVSKSQVVRHKTCPPKQKRPRPAVDTCTAAALDRTKTSDRNAVYILSAFAIDMGTSVNELALNRSSIRRARMKLRQQTAEDIKTNFAPNVPLTVHWDGKMLPEMTGKETVDRLPILVSGYRVAKLLGIPKLPSATGESQANAIFKCLQNWKLEAKVKAMSFDTTASNTGGWRGACTLLQQKLGNDLLNLACRHHIFEILLEKVYTECMNSISSGPDIALFKRFQEKFRSLNLVAYNTLMDDEELKLKVSPYKEDVLSFCMEHLQKEHPRDDYRELLELSIIILGEVPP